MRLQTSIEGIEAEVDQNKLVFLSKSPLRVLSSAGLNGGLAKATGIVNIHLSKKHEEEAHRNPEESMAESLVELDLRTERTVAMMTAADVQNVGASIRKNQDVTLSVFVTAGVDVGATAGEATVSRQGALNAKSGTINVILIIDGNLTDGCLVDAAKTVTEAKTVALRELDVRSHFSGDLASGTVTDTVAVACTGRGKPIKYAGTGTVLGESIGRSVRDALKDSLWKQQRIAANRPLTQRLRDRGIIVANVAANFSETHPAICGDLEKMRKFRDRLEEVLADPNVASILIVALRIDEDARLGLIPSLVGDKSLIREVLETAAVKYLFKGKESPGALRRGESSVFAPNLGPVTNSVLSAIMTVIYESA